MSSKLKYLSTKNCACCSVRLDRTYKRGLTTLRDDEIINALNSVKNKILTEKKKTINNTLIKKGDIVCGSCRTAASFTMSQ
jgi:hypothetical protein